MKKSISISIRVSEEELEKFKQAARLEAYASYSEFVRRTALIEASRIIKENDIDIDSMKINDLIKFIQENPSVLKRPIMIDERRFQVGYNAEEIRVFIPKELRKLAECHDMDRCPQFSNKDCLNFKKEYERDREKESSH